MLSKGWNSSTIGNELHTWNEVWMRIEQEIRESLTTCLPRSKSVESKRDGISDSCSSFTLLIKGFLDSWSSFMHAFLPKSRTVNDDDLLLYLNTMNWPSSRLFSFTNLFQPFFKKTLVFSRFTSTCQTLPETSLRTIFSGIFWSKCLIKSGGIRCRFKH